MLRDILNLNKGTKRSKPVRDTNSRTVSADRFNEMIDYYTAELKSRLKEIARLREENDMLIKTSIRNASRSDELKLQNQKLMDELRKLHGR